MQQGRSPQTKNQLFPGSRPVPAAQRQGCRSMPEGAAEATRRPGWAPLDRKALPVAHGGLLAGQQSPAESAGRRQLRAGPGLVRHGASAGRQVVIKQAPGGGSRCRRRCLQGRGWLGAAGCPRQIGASLWLWHQWAKPVHRLMYAVPSGSLVAGNRGFADQQLIGRPKPSNHCGRALLEGVGTEAQAPGPPVSLNRAASKPGRSPRAGPESDWARSPESPSASRGQPLRCLPVAQAQGTAATSAGRPRPRSGHD